ncbi:MAG TPA: hypothetical protein VK453_00515 [Micromonosporaceae bacterium]|nr:hypothetical protein [Micromonosporaceae bacterium]
MTSPKPSAATPSRRAWHRPVIECREVRPEVTAYAGAGDPWFNR